MLYFSDDNNQADDTYHFFNHLVELHQNTDCISTYLLKETMYINRPSHPTFTHTCEGIVLIFVCMQALYKTEWTMLALHNKHLLSR